jgi:hypothetical protein
MEPSPGARADKYVFLKYVGHIAVMTGRKNEAMDASGAATVSDLLDRLDEKYPGLKETFMPKNGVFNSRTGIILRRANQPTFSVINEQQVVEEGDILTLW